MASAMVWSTVGWYCVAWAVSYWRPALSMSDIVLQSVPSPPAST
jgi:hypothetical protein